jgi:hypothetical protein
MKGVLMTLPIRFAVGINNQSGVHGSSAGWCQLCNIEISEPRLERLEMLMANKAIRGEADALRFNAKKYLELVDENAEAALYDALDKIRQRYTKYLQTSAAVVTVSLVIGLWPLTVTAVLTVFNLVHAIFATRSSDAMEAFAQSRYENFDERLDRLCSSWMSHDE